MKRIAITILCFFIGFYGMSLFTETPELILYKSKVFFCGIILATILLVINDFREINN